MGDRRPCGDNGSSSSIEDEGGWGDEGRFLSADGGRCELEVVSGTGDRKLTSGVGGLVGMDRRRAAVDEDDGGCDGGERLVGDAGARREPPAVSRATDAVADDAGGLAGLTDLEEVEGIERPEVVRVVPGMAIDVLDCRLCPNRGAEDAEGGIFGALGISGVVT